MAITKGGFVTLVGNAQVATSRFVGALLGLVAAVLAAVTDDGNYRVFWKGTHIWSATGGVATKITATFGGVAADIKAITLTVVGTDAADAPLTEVLPAATVNTAGSVTSVNAFKTIDKITIPAHDGTGATTSVGILGGSSTAVIPAFTDKGVQAVHEKAAITDPDVPRNITATSGGVNTDVKAIQPIVHGTNENGTAISETLPAFTVNVNGDVVGSKAFKTITSVEIPPHDGNGATTSFGTGAKLGLGAMLSRDSILNAYLNGVREATRPTVAFDADEIEKNTVTLNSALNGTDVIVDFLEA